MLLVSSSNPSQICLVEKTRCEDTGVVCLTIVVRGIRATYLSTSHLGPPSPLSFSNTRPPPGSIYPACIPHSNVSAIILSRVCLLSDL